MYTRIKRYDVEGRHEALDYQAEKIAAPNAELKHVMEQRDILKNSYDAFCQNVQVR